MYFSQSFCLFCCHPNIFFFLLFQKHLIVSDHSIRVAYFGFHMLLYFEHWVFLVLDNVFSKMPRYVKAIADVIYKGFFWVFGNLLSFFADVLLRQTEKFRNHLGISLPVYLAHLSFESWNIITTAHKLILFVYILLMLLQNHVSHKLGLVMIMINCFCGMVDQQKALGLISSWDHCQRFSSSKISNTPRAGFEPKQNLSSGFIEWSCAVVITTTPWLHYSRFTSRVYRVA